MSPETVAVLEYTVSFALIVLMKIVCFILGYLTIRLGYLLIESGAKGEFKFSASFGGNKTDLASVSPGLLFVLLGVLLMVFAVSVEKPAKQTFEITQKKMDLPAGEVAIPGNSDLPTFGKSKKGEKK